MFVKYKIISYKFHSYIFYICFSVNVWVSSDQVNCSFNEDIKFFAVSGRLIVFFPVKEDFFSVTMSPGMSRLFF